ncbi:PREDICTED: formin-like protein 3 isoform X3 [Cercocebus atys]|uniref:formin-like protein 3 isoform X3 n=1 Tax=Cercocebus atys TaxID=9531 RepID=UPI0005F58847|nr:PREDICTED: formin-like protein 3 isoform X3 [Cercocebus atys]
MGNLESAEGGPGEPPSVPLLLPPGKMPMPEPCELEERFALVLSSMNLPPDKARLLRQYDNEKKWDLICDQERFQVKNPPHTYIQKLQSFLDPSVTRKKFRRRVQESTKVLRELEISLRTNHIGWVREFLNDENKGLDVLVDYLSFAQCSVMFDFEGLESGDDGAFDKLRSWSRSIEDLQPPSALSAPFTNSLARSARQSVLRLSSLAFCLPVCLWSVLSVSLTLPSGLSWFFTLPLQLLGDQLPPNLAAPCIPFTSSFRPFLSKGATCSSVCLRCLESCPAWRYSTLPGRRALKNSRLVSQKDDVHVCILCLRAIMNYQYGFNLVMSHPHAVNEIALSLNNKNPRTKALVLELLAAVCLVRGGHEIILAAFDNFKEVCKELHRFEKLMEYFRNEDSNIDFMVACMQFINIVVHSVEDMNFRVHLQYEFTKLGLEEFLQSRHTESEKLQVQIQAYLDNVFDVGGLLEDAETKNVALEKVEELEEHVSHLTEKLLDLENENMMRVAELEKQLLQREKELESIKETYENTSHQVHTLRRLIKEKEEAFQRRCHLEPSVRGLESVGSEALARVGPAELSEGMPPSNLDLLAPATPPEEVLPLPPPPAPPLPPPPPPLPDKCPPAPPLPGAAPSVVLTVGLSAIRIKKPIKTKFRLPVFNWTALKPNQISGTVFSELDDEKILEDLDLDKFEELFKTKAQGPALDLICSKNKTAQKAASKVTLLEANRAKNLAITLRKAGRSAEEICRAIHTFDLQTLPVDFVECLMRFLPTEAEVKLLRQYERERQPLEELAAEDRFMLLFSKVERLTQRMAGMAFLGNFQDNLQMLTPQLNAIIAASASVKSSQKLKQMLEIILALGNYMNSSKRGAVYGFKLQSLDLLLDTKSTDRKMTLLHFIALTVKEKYPDLANFWHELHFVEKAAAVSLENVLLDVKELGRGMELIRRECSIHDNSVLRNFLSTNEGKLDKLQRDAKTAEEAYNAVVRYFGESPKTTPPSVFFPVFVRFIRSYKEAEQENEARKKQEEVMREKQLAQEAKKLDAKTPSQRNKWQQQELIAELRRRQAKEHRPVYEGKDGTIEDIITVLKSVPFTARTAKRGSRFFCDAAHHDESNC